MKHLHTSVEIDAQPQKIWSVLTDFPRYALWNPFLVELTGECVAGAQLNLLMDIPDKGRQAYRVKLVTLREIDSFEWLGHFGVPGLIDGRHKFALTPVTSDRTSVEHSEDFGGLLVPFVWRAFIDRYLRKGFEELNANLKAYCEGRPLPVPLRTAK